MIERLNSQCIICLLNKYLEDLPKEISSIESTEYLKGILSIIANADVSMSAPEIVCQINQFKQKYGINNDFSKIKTYFNKLLRQLEKGIEEKIIKSDYPLKTAVKYAMAGNFIDFGAMKSVDEQKLMQTLENSDDIAIDDSLLEQFNAEIVNAKVIAYLTDNCGEIVLDKLLIKEIKRLNPDVKINAIVRGLPVLNDCTIEDARQVGMDKIADVLDNGTAIGGTVLGKISSQAEEIINISDLIISKGQGNFETLYHSGKNIYYLFLCKCHLFAERFNVDKMTGIFINDRYL